MTTRNLIPYSPVFHHRKDDRFDFIMRHVHGELRQLYWKSGGRRELGLKKKLDPRELTVEYLLTLPGNERAGLLRANPGLRSEYLRIVDKVPGKRKKWPEGMSKAVALAMGLVE